MGIVSKVIGTVPKCTTPIPSQIFQLMDFVRSSRQLVVVTGAGVSTESGIRDYRSAGIGQYAIGRTPILTYNDFLSSEDTRKKFWLRNFMKWPGLSMTTPNSTHKALAQWENRGHLSHLITQNIDGLHLRAGSKKVIEFHGSEAKVICLKCKEKFPRSSFQELISEENLTWLQEAELQMTPEGNVSVRNGSLEDFHIPKCPCCSSSGGTMKPDIVFFGEEVPKQKVDAATRLVSESDGLLVVGSSLQVYSGYYLVLEAKKHGKKVAILNVSWTRADELADLVIQSKCSDAVRIFEHYEGGYSHE